MRSLMLRCMDEGLPVESASEDGRRVEFSRKLSKAEAETYRQLLADSRQVVFTPSEHEVLQMIVQGLQNKEIAALRRCTTQTVKNTAWRIYRKFGVDNRIEAMRKAIREGYASL